ncbi:MAG: alanine--tRNA ligase [bacterium]|nr:alanine--tRNA ligase [bacterium]
MTGKEIRQKFLKYFEEQGHKIMPSSSLIPDGDPTLLFSNAGMNQFKKIFTGEEDRGLRRVSTVQKCMRAGGKHNDLENVGRTNRHHTFFEMLGNFSFGDYFKKEAIGFAWELLTKCFGFDPKDLWITVYKKDEEAFALWQSVAGVSPERISRMGEEDNFWMMGETGPCGPCSEIMFDQGPGVGCGKPDCRVGCSCDRYLELWNLVFMEFNRTADGNMSSLPRKSIDTGMGLERITAVLQGKTSNYDSDLFTPLIRAIEAQVSGLDPEKHLVSVRVAADHSRAASFLVADGVIPGNEGRGYVLRRIIRRAARHLFELGIREPFLYRLTGVVADAYADVYPELREREMKITRILKGEEERFLITIERGMELLSAEMEKMAAEKKLILPGEMVFRLYDTFGFPVDLTLDILRDRNLSADLAAFEKEMELQRQRGKDGQDRNAGAEETERIAHLVKESGAVLFLGYESLQADSKVEKILREGVEVDSAGPDQEEIRVITRETPFYGEVGGQMGDAGMISGPGLQAEVVYTERPHVDLIIHRVKVKSGEIRKGMSVTLSVDAERRTAIARNHTATHLLQAALRKVRGDEIRQAGSLVAPERLRFDFTCFSPLSPAEREKVEDMVNEAILKNLPVVTRVMSYQEGLKSGATAIFEEKYGSSVRVVEVEGISRELCGGTHMRRTGDIGLLKILGESSVAAGVRRIEALTGEGTFRYLRSLEDTVRESGEILKVEPATLPRRIQELRDELKTKDKEIERLQMKNQAQTADEILDKVRQISGVSCLAVEIPGLSPAALREVAEKIRGKIKSGIVVLGSRTPEKAALVAMVTKDLTAKFDAVKIIRGISGEVGGGGGGRADMAQAGGNQPDGLPRALARVETVLKEMIEK